MKATATIIQGTENRTMDTIQPDSTTEVEGKTYVNLRPVEGLPSFPVSFAPAGMNMDAFLPIDPDEALVRGYADGMTAAWPNQATPSTAATVQMQQWLNNTFSAKRPAEETHDTARPYKRSVTRRSPPSDPRRNIHGPSTRNVSTNNRRDAATDAYELQQHTAQFEKAAMIVRCCPILGIDVNGPTPDDEDPRWFYLVLQNLRDCCLTTRELILALLDRYGEPAELTFTRTGRDSFSAFLAYRTIAQLLRVARHVPDRIARREIRTLLANSRYFPDKGDAPEMVRHYCKLDRLFNGPGPSS